MVSIFSVEKWPRVNFQPESNSLLQCLQYPLTTKSNSQPARVACNKSDITANNWRRGQRRVIWRMGRWGSSVLKDSSKRKEKKPYPRPSLPCGHTHIWERLGEGNTNIKSQMGGLCSTSNDGKQPMKKVQLSNHLFLRFFLEVCVWPTTQPRKTYCSSTTNQNQYTLGQIVPSSRGRMMLSVQRNWLPEQCTVLIRPNVTESNPN